MMADARPEFVQVAIPSGVPAPLIYRVPERFQESLQIGMRVLVPLGTRKVTGVVSAFAQHSTLPRIREILDMMDDHPILDASLLELCRWISKYYISPLGEALATVLPPTLRLESQRMVTARDGSFALKGKLEREIVALLQSRKRILLKSLGNQLSGRGINRALSRLVSIGAVEIEDKIKTDRRRAGRKEPAAEAEETVPGRKQLKLTADQGAALQSMEESLAMGGFATFLLYGVTGSGKTEVYLRAIERVSKQNKRSLILVPEISLTPQLKDRLLNRFPGQVGMLHSALTSAERYTQWWRIARGEVNVVLGARSAIFAPIPDLGLIIVDEEHDTSYKQEEGLRYNARDLAVVRGKLLSCPVLLGSATPSIESYHNCQLKRYQRLDLRSRVEEQSLPHVEIVDLRQDLMEQPAAPAGSSGGGIFFSRQLIKALQENHKLGHQSLIFLNRRGFANFLQCKLCGFVLRCPQCSISLTYHRNEQSVFCHHCGFRKPFSDLCPSCDNSTLAGVGFGTEKLEEELLRFIPEAKIGRMDRDTTSKRGAHERLFRQWEKGEIEILVGTQMIAKGHDVAGVTLVGVISADLSLNLPDFRAAERTFQILLQVAGRAGRGANPGRVIVQTYLPDHYSFQFAATHDYESFFASEIEFRRDLGYPPFGRLVQLRLDGLKAKDVEQKARSMGASLRRYITNRDKGAEQIEILGPAPAPIEKLRNRYRWQILLKGKKGPPLLDLAKAAQGLCPQGNVRLHIDVDPYNML